MPGWPSRTRSRRFRSGPAAPCARRFEVFETQGLFIGIGVPEDFARADPAGRALMGAGRPALFLDRDGVINFDHGYVCRPQDFELIDRIFEPCRAAQQQGYLIVVVTNQAGIGRGYYSEADFAALTAWMVERFAAEGITIDGVYFCPFHPEHGIGPYKADATCRKPHPGMIVQAAKEHGMDLARSVLVGDKPSDIAAGVAAGVGRLFRYQPAGEGGAGEMGAEVVGDLSEVVLPGVG